MAKAGRPKIKIDWDTIDELAKIQCNCKEIAAVLGLHYDTLNEKCKKEHKMKFSEYLNLKAEAGKSSLRRYQWKNAKKGNHAMQIWLGKQYLKQTDKSDITTQGEKINLIVSPGFLPEGEKDD